MLRDFLLKRLAGIEVTSVIVALIDTYLLNTFGILILL
jgi:hypothetical protein